MELNRNQWFVIGVVVLFIGLQLRRVESVVLTPEASRFIAKKLNRTTEAPPGMAMVAKPLVENPPEPRRVVRPPDWLGWMLTSIGAVLILHSLAMPRPG